MTTLYALLIVYGAGSFQNLTTRTLVIPDMEEATCAAALALIRPHFEPGGVRLATCVPQRGVRP